MNSSRQNRGPTNRGQGRGGRSRGGFNDRNNSSPGMKPVPSIQQVIPGAPVSIVLKIDQPTGSEVQGIVAGLLTRGDHPRGIKVRLQDGRVGRVQRMVSEETAKAATEGLSELGRNGEIGGGSNVGVQTTSAPIGGFSARRYGDYRVDEPGEPPGAGLSLVDYVVTKGKKGRQKKGSVEDANPNEEGFDTRERPSDTSILEVITKCPVCGEFEGDEMAVAHHVNGHFE